MVYLSIASQSLGVVLHQLIGWPVFRRAVVARLFFPPQRWVRMRVVDAAKRGVSTIVEGTVIDLQETDELYGTVRSAYHIPLLAIQRLTVQMSA
jgi:hypothetical protein